MLNHVSLSAAFGLTKIQEEYVLSTRRSFKSTVGLSHNYSSMGVNNGEKEVRKSNFQSRKVSSMKLMREKRGSMLSL